VEQVGIANNTVLTLYHERAKELPKCLGEDLPCAWLSTGGYFESYPYRYKLLISFTYKKPFYYYLYNF